MTIDLLVDAKNVLGEGPVWDVTEQRLYWVDILGRTVQRCSARGEELQTWRVPGDVGALALRKSGGAIVALRDGFFALDLATGSCSRIAEPIKESGTRFNDGKVDRRGRFFAGTMDYAEKESIGALYRLDGDLSYACVERSVMVSNGPCWSPDDRIFYFTDTWTDTIFAYDYDIETGVATNRRAWHSTSGEPGYPDGSTVDADGCLWTAHAYGSCIYRYTPAGDVDRVIEMPVPNVTSVMFGGRALDVLFVTSMVQPTVGEPGPLLPGAGGLFAITGLGVCGLPETRFAG